MISVVIASVNPAILENVKKNIEETIGVPFEILAYENSDGQRGICEIYNQGAKDAKYDFVCYSHEDIVLKTIDWGRNVISLFEEDKKLGLLGIAGSVYKSLSVSGWMDLSDKNERSNLIQHFKHSNRQTLHHIRNPNQEKLCEVTCVDGVWFVTRKHIALENSFDEITFRNFHCYDVDYSLTVGLNHKIAVSYDILIEHLSEGNFGREWLEEAIKLHKKWNQYLPKSSVDFSAQEIFTIEKKTFRYFYEMAKKVGLKNEFLFASLYDFTIIRKLGLVYFFKNVFYATKNSL